MATSGLHHACAHIIKHNMKYSLLLPPNTGFIFAEDKSPRKPASVKVSTQRCGGELEVRGLGGGRRNATQTLFRQDMGVNGLMCGEYMAELCWAAG